MSISKRFFTSLFLIALNFYSCDSYAAVSVLSVYDEARKHNPDVQIARENAYARQETIAIDRSFLLPKLMLDASGTKASDNEGSPALNGQEYDYNLNLDQTLFNLGQWLRVNQASFDTKSAFAIYAASMQMLLSNTVVEYLKIAENDDLVQLSNANQNSLKRGLKLARLRFQAGVIKAADLSNVKAAYDSSYFSVIDARNQLKIAEYDLQALTGKFYADVKHVRQNFVPQSPQPIALQKWEMKAREQNLMLLAAHFSETAARENIKIADAGHLPTVNLRAGLSGLQSRNNGIETTQTHALAATLRLSLPIYQGGLVVANTQQAQYQYESAVSNTLKVERQTVRDTEVAYVSILNDIDKIQHGRRAVLANRDALAKTKIAYESGINSMMDVLRAQQALFITQREYLMAIYTYLTDYIQLKLAVGALTVKDLEWVDGLTR